MPQPERGGDEGAFMLMVSTDSNPPFFPVTQKLKAVSSHILYSTYISVFSLSI